MPSTKSLIRAATTTKALPSLGREPEPNIGLAGSGLPQKRVANKAAQRHSEAYGGGDAIDWVMTCVDLYAQAASNSSFHFERNDKELERVPADLQALFNRPNPYTDWTELIELAIIDLITTGEFIWLKYKPNDQGKPLALYRLAPQHVKVVPSENGLRPKAYEYTAPGGTPVTFPADEVLHVKRPNPHDPYRGLGFIAGGPRAFDIELALTDQTAAYYEQGTRLSGVLESDRTVPDSTFQKLKRTFAAMYSGTKNAGSVATLERGLKFRPISATATDAMLKEMSSWNRERIASTFKVPLAMLGNTSGSDKAAVREAKRIFANDVMRPFLNRVASQISYGLTQAWGLDFKFDYQYEMPIEDKLDLAQSLASLPGVQVHQVLELVDLEPTGDESIDNLVLNLPGKSTDPETEKRTGQEGHADKPMGSEPGRPPNAENTVAIPRGGKLPETASARLLKKALDDRLAELRLEVGDGA